MSGIQCKIPLFSYSSSFRGSYVKKSFQSVKGLVKQKAQVVFPYSSYHAVLYVAPATVFDHRQPVQPVRDYRGRVTANKRATTQYRSRHNLIGARVVPLHCCSIFPISKSPKPLYSVQWSVQSSRYDLLPFWKVKSSACVHA